MLYSLFRCCSFYYRLENVCLEEKDITFEEMRKSEIKSVYTVEILMDTGAIHRTLKKNKKIQQQKKPKYMLLFYAS